MTKANLFQANEQQNLKNLINANDKSDSGIDIDAVMCNSAKMTGNGNNSITGLSTTAIDFGSSTENFTSSAHQNHSQNTKTNRRSAEHCFDIDSSTCTTATTSAHLHLSVSFSKNQI